MREVLSGRGLREHQRGSRCEWVLGFARTAVMRAGSNMGRGGLSRRLGRAAVSVSHVHVCGVLHDMNGTELPEMASRNT